MQISIHELINQVDISETSPVSGHHHVLERNHILMPDVPQQFQLPQRPQRINPILEHVVDLLYSHFLVGLPVDGGANDAVRPSTYRLDGHVFGVNLEQSLPHGVVMLPLWPYPIWRLHHRRHFFAASTSLVGSSAINFKLKIPPFLLLPPSSLLIAHD